MGSIRSGTLYQPIHRSYGGPLRRATHIRGLQGNMEVRNDAPSQTDYLEDVPHQIAKDFFIPMIQAKSSNAVKVDRHDFFYYQKKRSGRRCSCFTTETSPDGMCQICYGFGIVGAYDKYGCRTEIIDTTRMNVNMVNVYPNYEKGIRPVMFSLDKGATEGYLETRIDTLANVRQLDLFQLIKPKQRGLVSLKVRSINELNFVDGTEGNINARLGDNLIVRVVLSRKNMAIQPPDFSHLFFRYKLLNENIIYGDQPRADESVALSEFGLYENYQTMSFFFDHTIEVLTTEDMVVRLDDMRRFKLINVKKNKPLNILTSTDVNARYLIPGVDSLIRFPL